MGFILLQQTDLKDQMQQSGGLLLATARRSETSIFAPKRAKMQTNLASSSKTLKLLEFRGFSCFCALSQTASFFTQFRERMWSCFCSF